MAITINGDGSISGISVGGLPDGTVDAGTLATNSVDSAELVDGAVDNSHMAAMAASKLTGALPAISGASLTGLTSSQMPTGSVLQVKDSVFYTNTSTTSTSFNNTGHYVNITPTASSSKFLIQLAGGGNGNHAGNSWAMTTFYRDSTELSGISIGMQTLVGGDYVYGSHSISWIDSPSTTSQISYKVYFRTNNANNTAYYNWSDRGKVHLTVTEIAG